MQIGNRMDVNDCILYQNSSREIQDLHRIDAVSDEEENEPVQIGARSFSDKEWKDFLDRFDAVQDAVRELMKERQEKFEKEQQKEKSENE